MATSIKISNVRDNKDEFISRIKQITSPGKKKLFENLAKENWRGVYTELLYRIELYARTKVLNYTRQDLNNIIGQVRKIMINNVVDALVKNDQIKYNLTPALIPDVDDNNMSIKGKKGRVDRRSTPEIIEWVEKNYEFIYENCFEYTPSRLPKISDISKWLCDELFINNTHLSISDYSTQDFFDYWDN